MRLVVKEANGQLHTLQVEPQYRFGQLQKMIYQAVPSIALDSQKLVLGSRLLNERRNESIKVAGLKDGDVVVLLAARPRPTRSHAGEQAEAPPTARAILAATQRRATKGETNLAANGHSRRPKEGRRRRTRRVSLVLPALDSEIFDRESLLAEAEAEAEEAAEEHDHLQQHQPHESEERLRLPRVPPLALQGLLEMGFPVARAHKALLLNGMNVRATMEWLFTHADDEDVDSPLTEEERRRVVERARNFSVDSEAVRQLSEMGFNEEEVTRALEYSGNDQEVALSWLIGDQREAGYDDETNENDGFGEAVRAVFGGHEVRGQVSDQVLQALQNVLMNPQTAINYLNDPEIGSILQQLVAEADDDDSEESDDEEELQNW